MMEDFFRPQNEPARSIYDALLNEAEKREGREPEEWQQAERMAVWRAARDYAEAHGLIVPTWEQVIESEHSATGHVDYGAKWAYGVTSAMQRKEDSK